MSVTSKALRHAPVSTRHEMVFDPSVTGSTEPEAIEQDYDRTPDAEGASGAGSRLVRKRGVSVGKSQPPSEDEVSGT